MNGQKKAVFNSGPNNSFMLCVYCLRPYKPGFLRVKPIPSEQYYSSEADSEDYKCTGMVGVEAAVLSQPHLMR